MIKFFKNKNKYQVLDISIFIIISFVSAILGILNFAEVVNFELKQILSLILIVLALLASSTLIERYGILEKIINEVYNNKTNVIKLTTRKEVEEEYSLDKRFEGASEVSIITQCSRTLFQPENITYIEDAIDKGTKFKIVMINPFSESANENLRNKMFNYIGNPMQDGLEYYKRFSTASDKFSMNVEYRTTDINITYGMMIVKKNNGYCFIKIDLYTYTTADKFRRCFIINHNDAENLRFYLDQWKIVWDGATPFVVKDI